MDQSKKFKNYEALKAHRDSLAGSLVLDEAIDLLQNSREGGVTRLAVGSVISCADVIVDYKVNKNKKGLLVQQAYKAPFGVLTRDGRASKDRYDLSTLFSRWGMADVPAIDPKIYKAFLKGKALVVTECHEGIGKDGRSKLKAFSFKLAKED